MGELSRKLRAKAEPRGLRWLKLAKFRLRQRSGYGYGLGWGFAGRASTANRITVPSGLSGWLG
eukprot:7683860-Karenia_brevis.AAC.1